jgi:hypothetical protein
MPCLNPSTTLTRNQTRKDVPYLTQKRFPNNWAIAEIVKQYLRGQNKQNKRKLKQAATKGKGDEDDEDDEDQLQDDDEDDERPPCKARKTRHIDELDADEAD